MTHHHDDADEAIARAMRAVRNMRDEIEWAQRVPGDRVELTRQVSDDMIDGLNIIARAFVTISERRR